MRLGQLIHSRKKQLSATWPDLVANAKSARRPISRATLIEFGNDVLGTSVHDDTVLAIAAAIKTPVPIVWEAITETKGYKTATIGTGDASAQMFALLADKLPPEQVDRVLQSLAMQVRAYEMIEGIDPAAADPAECATD